MKLFSMPRNLAPCALIAILTFSAVAVAAPDADLEARQEAIAIAWIEAHNSADVDTMAAFRAKHFQLSELKDWQPTFQRMVEELGTLKVRGVMIDGAGQIKVRVHASGPDESLRLGFTFDADRPDQIRMIGADMGGGGDGEDGIPTADISGSDWSERSPKLDRYLAQLAADGYFSGTVLIADRNGVQYRKAVGLASREFAVPNTLETRFDIGSCNKDYTRIAILALRDQGKLSLEDKVGRHLPDYPNERVRNEVTVGQLLEHRSGLGDYFTDEWFKTPMGSLREIEDYIPIWGPKPLLHEPGSKEFYSNYGYTVLGAIIETLSGERFDEHVARTIFEPLGMTRTGFFETDAVVPDVAVGYTHLNFDGSRRQQPVKNIYLEPAKGGPWGKSYATVDDMHRFYSGIIDGKLLSGDSNFLAGGWDRGGIALAGGGPGLSATMLLDGGYMVIVLANMDPPSSELLSGILAEGIKR